MKPTAFALALLMPMVSPVHAQALDHPDSFSTVLTDSSVQLVLRNYAESLQLDGYPTRNAWNQGARLAFVSGLTGGDSGIGVDATAYGVVKLGGGDDVHNLALIGPNGVSRSNRAWAYLGEYAVKARAQGVDVKYGLMAFNGNPFLDPYDTRTHPPTFRGVSAVAHPTQWLTVVAGGANAMFARGANFYQPLATNVSGTTFKRQIYMGAEWDYGDDRQLKLYASRSQDLWDQYYASATRSMGSADGVRWTGKTDLYYTTEQGARMQGAINNKAFSASITAQHRSSSLQVGFQHIDSDQFFDYTKDTTGIALDNAMGVDYNAPHEQSLLLRYRYDGKMDGLPGFQLSVWGVHGSGADGRAEAAKHAGADAPLHGVYWQNGAPIAGAHGEIGSRITYVVQQGPLKDLRASLFVMKHRMNPSYPYIDFAVYRLTCELPLKLR